MPLPKEDTREEAERTRFPKAAGKELFALSTTEGLSGRADDFHRRHS